MFRRWSATTIFGAAGAGLLTAILCSCTGAASSKNKIAQILQQYHRNDKFSGAALVGYGDTVVYEGAFGLADETWKIANTPATRFQIGSLTKQFTAALILELAQQGRLNLAATLSTYSPDYRRDVADAVTIRQLLGHSAGVPDFVRRSDIMQILKEPATPQEVIIKYCSNALEFTPGTQFKYSNCGYLILGALYEQVTGETYADGLRRLTARAGLTDTGISGPRAIVPRLAAAYVVENGQQIESWARKRCGRYLRPGRLATHSAGTWDELIRRNFALFSRATMTHSRRLNAPTCCLPHTRVTSPAFTAA